MPRLVLTGVCTAVVLGLIHVPIPVCAQPKTVGVVSARELGADIRALQTRQKELERNLELVSRVDEAKWDLVKLVLILVLGGGGVVFVGIYNVLKKVLKEKLDDHLEKRIGTQINLSDGKRLFSHGYLTSDIATVYARDSSEWRSFLSIALDNYKEALPEFEKLPKDYATRQRWICSLKNNMAYALTLLRDLESREEAMRYAKDAYDKASEYPDGFHWEDTYGWVLLVFAKNPYQRQEALTLLEALYNRPRLPQPWVAKRRNDLQNFLNGQ